MSESSHKPSAPSPAPSYARPTSSVHGTLVEFEDVTSLTHACEAVRDAGFTKWDAHTPFPVHGLDDAMGIRPTKLPWLVLGCGLFGLVGGLFMQCWFHGYDYKWVIGGKPFISLPAFVPVTFELTVLCSAFATFFGSLAFNGLPQLFHPLHLVKRFRRATNDRFFIYIESRDPNYEPAKVESLLAPFAPTSLEMLRYESQGVHNRLPRGTVGVTLVLIVLSLAPFALAARARERTSLRPRIHANPPAPVKDDMDSQYKFGAQTTNWFFNDQRAARQWPAGTVALQDAAVEGPVLTGRAVSAVAPPPPPLHEAKPKAQKAVKQALKADDGAQLEQPSVPMHAPDAPFLTHIPSDIVLTEKAMARGKERFTIYCSTCHGIAGHGDGMVARHADALQEGTWVSPSNLHEQRVRDLAVGEVYSAITHGVRNMPAYGHLIEPTDRWLIVAYVKALQRSLWAPKSDVPADVTPSPN